MKLPCLLLLIDLAVASQLTVSPSCPSSSSLCTTIDDLSLPTQGNITVVFLPGTHTLEGSLSIQDRPNDHISFVGTPGETTIECTSSSRAHDIAIQQVASINIANTTLSGCKLRLSGNSVSVVQSGFVDAVHGSLVVSSSSAVLIEHVSFNNSHTSYPNYVVVEVSASRNVEISHSLFFDNVPGVHGRVVVLRNSTGSISYCSFQNNTADVHGSVIEMDSSNGSISYCSFRNNSADVHGNVIEMRSTNGSISYCSFHNNSIVGTHGNIVEFFISNASMSYCSFQNNSAVPHGWILAGNGQNLVQVTKSTFTDNWASSYGGILEFRNDYHFEVSRSNFTGNIVERGGSIIEAYSAIGFVSCCYFHDNVKLSNIFGAIIRSYGRSTLHVTNSTFTENSASLNSYNSGIILVDSSSDYVGVISSVFMFNSGYDGVINLDAAGEVAVLGSDISHNACPGIVVSSGSITVDCTHFYNNSGIGSINSQIIRITNTTFCLENFMLGQEGGCAANNNEGNVKIY